MDEIDRRIINGLQDGFPLSPTPYADAANALGLDEDVLLQRLKTLRADNVLTRFGPLFNAEAMGGGLTLAAMKVPEDRFEKVAEIVSSFPEVAHNYAREHALNMWFVVATERPEEVQDVLDAIADGTGLEVFNMPKQEEFTLCLRFEA
ncbi:MAG TPA: AsnC family transcriptional regulator [Candidatus Sulfotelmatobacter sp.]|jgi:DNA-binding Lrp family transcriptional regulator|nr:AsnC family transcriptional regulator [Candidatus Sulfotelmatobacter sp.]